MNWELPYVQARSRKGRGTRGQFVNIRWIIENAREFQKNIYFCFIDYAKTFDCVDQKKLWKIPKEMWMPDHLICFLRNRYAGQEATVRTGHGTTDWFQIGKGECQGSVLSHCLFNVYAVSQFSCSDVSDSLRPCGRQHARPPCPSLIHRAWPNSCPSSR